MPRTQVRDGCYSRLLLPAILLLNSIIIYIRVPGRFRNPMLWAEDGRYFQDAYHYCLQTLNQPIEGYYTLVHRIIALSAKIVSPQDIPAVFAVFAWLAPMAVVIMIFSPRLNVTPANRALMSLAVVISPVGNEIFMRMTNSILWAVPLVLILIALYRDSDFWGTTAADCIILLVAGLTGPFSILFLPIFAHRAYRKRSRHSILLFACCAVTSAIQLIPMEEIAGRGEAVAKDAEGLGEIFEIVSFLFLRLFAGDYIAGILSAIPFLAAIGSLAFLAALIFSAKKAFNSTDPIFVYSLVAGYFVILAAAYAYHDSPRMLIHQERYSYFIYVVFAWGVMAFWRETPLFVGALIAAIFSVSFIGSGTDSIFYMHDLNWKRRILAQQGRNAFVLQINPLFHRVAIGRGSEKPLLGQKCVPNNDDFQQYKWDFRHAGFGMIPAEIESKFPVYGSFEGDSNVLVAHAPTRIYFELPAGKHRISGIFGMLKTAYSSGASLFIGGNRILTSDGVSFLIWHTEGGGQKELPPKAIYFERTLDPLANPPDRLQQSFEFDFSSSRQMRLVLETAPGPGDFIGDHSYWANVEIR